MCIFHISACVRARQRHECVYMCVLLLVSLGCALAKANTRMPTHCVRASVGVLRMYVRASVGVVRMCRLRPTLACPHTGQVDGRIANMDPNVPTMQVIFVYISVLRIDAYTHACCYKAAAGTLMYVCLHTHTDRFAYAYISKCLCTFFTMHAYMPATRPQRRQRLSQPRACCGVCVHAKTVRIIRLDV